MKQNYFLAAAIFCTAGGPLCAQMAQSAGIVYQQAGVLGAPSGGPTSIGVLSMARPAMALPVTLTPVTGSPFTATSQSHSLQVLGDGTRIERTDTQQMYRDSMGRTRTESGPAGAATVVIQDPVAGQTLVLDTAAKTVREMPMPRLLSNGAASSPPTPGPNGQAPAAAVRVTKFLSSGVAGPAAAITAAGPIPVPGEAGDVAFVQTQTALSDSASGNGVQPQIQNLPAQDVNGVLATGRRTTLTIPAGQIGNDRPLQIVSETWYSSDLQIMVKSSNSDPRFGDTTYELTGIVRTEPDPSLFQVPADYTVSEPKPMSYQFKDSPAKP